MYMKIQEQHVLLIKININSLQPCMSSLLIHYLNDVFTKNVFNKDNQLRLNGSRLYHIDYKALVITFL